MNDIDRFIYISTFLTGTITSIGMKFDITELLQGELVILKCLKFSFQVPLILD